MIDMVCKECGDVFSVNKAREKTAKFCSTRDAEIHSRANIVAVIQSYMFIIKDGL